MWREMVVIAVGHARQFSYSESALTCEKYFFVNATSISFKAVGKNSSTYVLERSCISSGMLQRLLGTNANFLENAKKARPALKGSCDLERREEDNKTPSGISPSLCCK